MEWQPIETAPKDGQEIILYGEMRQPKGISPKREDIEAHVFCGYYFAGLWQCGGVYIAYPSHWMPLPPPPQGA